MVFFKHPMVFLYNPAILERDSEFHFITRLFHDLKTDLTAQLMPLVLLGCELNELFRNIK